MKLKLLNEKNILWTALTFFILSIAFVGFAVSWKYAPYEGNQKPNNDNYIAFNFHIYIAIILFSLSILLLVIWGIIKAFIPTK